MTARLRLPRALSQTVGTPAEFVVEGDDLEKAMADLFRQEPGLRNHILDESGRIRPHVSLFVDAVQADLDTTVANGADIRVLHAVSGG